MGRHLAPVYRKVTMDLTFWILYICAVTCSLSGTVEMRSNPPVIPVSPQLKPKSFIGDIRTHTPAYTGFGKVHVYCMGLGDSTTRIHWIRTDKDGRSTTLNSTLVNLKHAPFWEATLLDRPNINKFPYDYQCVLKTNCCETKKSEARKITYLLPVGSDCPPTLFGFYFGTWKPIKVKAIPSERSVKFTWTYDPDPEDTGFLFDIRGAKILHITTREYVVHGLVPNTRYDFKYRILFGKGCKTIAHLQFFRTRKTLSLFHSY